MTDISIENYSLSAGSKKLLTDTKLVVSMNTRYGLVGPNGCGKSTLLNDINKHKDSLLVKQEVIASETSVEDEVASVNPILLKMIREEEEFGDETEDINPDLELSIIRKILAGLGFDNEMRKQPTSDFSGGWRMRISIAKALYSKPGLLLLDEPTNHLDQSAVVWLTDYLSRWSNGLVLVSHDRYFLNEVCQAIIAIKSKKLKTYSSKSNVFMKYKQAEEQLQRHQESEWKKWKKRLPKLRKEGKKKDEIDEIRLKEEIVEPEKPYEPRLKFTDPTEARGNIINCKEVTFSYDPDSEAPTLSAVDLSLDLDSRVTIVGKNGSGKSTILKLISGLMPMKSSDSGNIEINRHLRIGFFNQHFEDILDYSQSPVDFILDQHSDLGIGESDVRRKLGEIGLSGAQHKILIGDLSGGQKARVALVNIMFGRPHFLILDEPTNHLDLETNEALIRAINSFKGGLLMVTHNADLIIETNSVLYECDKGRLSKFKGTYEDYCDRIIREIDISV